MRYRLVVLEYRLPIRFEWLLSVLLATLPVVQEERQARRRRQAELHSEVPALPCLALHTRVRTHSDRIRAADSVRIAVSVGCGLAHRCCTSATQNVPSTGASRGVTQSS